MTRVASEKSKEVKLETRINIKQFLAGKSLDNLQIAGFKAFAGKEYMTESEFEQELAKYLGK